MPSTTIQFFSYTHLPEKLQEVSKPIYDLAQQMESTLPDGPEKSAGMRKLLEAKDCFVRSALAPASPERRRQVKVGDVVLYVLSDSDVKTIESKRAIGPSTDITSKLPPSIHYRAGNPLMAGQWLPAVVVAVFLREYGDEPGVNLQVLLDGTDTLWVTSVRYAAPSAMELGTWHWVEKA